MSDTYDVGELTTEIQHVSREVTRLHKRYRELAAKTADAEDLLLEATRRLNFLTARLLEDR